jgi:2-phosphoglycolate phosphatase
MALRAVLFDLDGTLVDSAPDLAGTANDLLARRGRAPLPLERLRPHGGSGARGMLGEAFGLQPGDAGYLALRDEFLDHYATRLLQATHVFEPVPALLQGLVRRGLAWGIVTNKAMRFAGPLAAALGLEPPAGCLVAGDSTPHAKPHPAPLLEAVRRLGLLPADCVYVGDDHRDMLAARAAGMAGWAAAWGYLGPGADPHAWGADQVLPDPLALLNRLETA